MKLIKVVFPLFFSAEMFEAREEMSDMADPSLWKNRKLWISFTHRRFFIKLNLRQTQKQSQLCGKLLGVHVRHIMRNGRKKNWQGTKDQNSSAVSRSRQLDGSGRRKNLRVQEGKCSFAEAIFFPQALLQLAAINKFNYMLKHLVNMLYLHCICAFQFFKH